MYGCIHNEGSIFIIYILYLYFEYSDFDGDFLPDFGSRGFIVGDIFENMFC